MSSTGRKDVVRMGPMATPSLCLSLCVPISEVYEAKWQGECKQHLHMYKLHAQKCAHEWIPEATRELARNDSHKGLAGKKATRSLQGQVFF